MSISQLNAAELLKPHSSRIYFISIDLAITPFHACTGTKDYTVFGDDFLGLGEIQNLGDLVSAADVAARPLVLTMSGVDPWITEPLLSRVNYKNRSVKIWRGFLDENEDLVDDPDLRWKGRADVGSVTLEDGTAVATLTCEPAAAMLLRANVSRYANEDHQMRYPGDKFFEYLAQMEGKEVLWGGVRVDPGQRGAGGQTGIGDGRGGLAHK